MTSNTSALDFQHFDHLQTQATHALEQPCIPEASTSSGEIPRLQSANEQYLKTALAALDDADIPDELKLRIISDLEEDQVTKSRPNVYILKGWLKIFLPLLLKSTKNANFLTPSENSSVTYLKYIFNKSSTDPSQIIVQISTLSRYQTIFVYRLAKNLVHLL